MVSALKCSQSYPCVSLSQLSLPSCQLSTPLSQRAEHSGLCRSMETSVPGIFAAGDVCCAAWEDMSPHWFQMRLWTQVSPFHVLCKAYKARPAAATLACHAGPACTAC